MVIDLTIIQRAYEGENSDFVRSYVLDSYKELFKKEVENQRCENCIHDAAIKILIAMKDERKYLLHSHIPLLHKGKWYTQPSLTDEIAEEYLKENPEHLYMFKRVPKQKATK